MDPRPPDPLIDALRAENEAMRSELELLRDAFERIPHGMCAFSGDDRLVLTKSVDIRGDNDESWRRGMAYMLCDLAKRRKRPPRYGMPP